MNCRHDMLIQGVYIVTTQHQDKLGGLAVAWGVQVAKDSFLICVGQQSATRELILESRQFGLNVLRSDQVSMGNWFGRQSIRKVDKFEGIPYHFGDHGMPLLDDCGAAYECEVADIFDRGTQKLIIGKVVFIETMVDGFQPLIYREEDYPSTKPLHPSKCRCSSTLGIFL